MYSKIRSTLAAFVLIVVLITAIFSLNKLAEDDENRALNGEWEFYLHQLLTPEDLKMQDLQAVYLPVPSSWKDLSSSRDDLSSFGYGTYRTTFRVSPEEIGAQQALSLYYVGSAYRIWIDGVEYKGLGTVGTSREEETPRLQRNLIRFSPTGEEVEIVMQVSNFSFREGGIISEIRYGDSVSVMRYMMIQVFFTLIGIGGTLLFGGYHLILYYLRKVDLAWLYIGLISVFYSVRTFLIAEYVVSIFFPELSWEAVIKAEYLVEIGMALLVGKFLRYMFPSDVSAPLYRIFVAAAVAALVYIAITPTHIFTTLIHALIVVGLLAAVILEITVKVQVRHHEDANLYLAGVLLLLIAIINDTLNYTLTIETFYMLKYAFVMFIIIQAIIASNRYHRIYENNARLTKELMILNSTLEERIEERTEELKLKNVELEELQKERTRMLANIAHDIGTPLAGVRTYLQIMKDGKIRIDKANVYEQLIEKLSYIQHLNQDLLKLSKLESKQLKLGLELVQVKALMQEMMEPFQMELPGDQIKVTLGEMETKINGEEAYVRVDRLRIMQVVQNFVTNAYKYIHSPEKMLTLHSRICSPEEGEEGHVVIFEFEDNGNGIHPADLPFLFDQFYRRVDGYVEGSGLGLAIVKGIIEQHGGQVGARTKKEAGAIFYFTLPASSELQWLRSGF
jgi:signal transduction histidine kinase